MGPISPWPQSLSLLLGPSCANDALGFQPIFPWMFFSFLDIDGKSNFFRCASGWPMLGPSSKNLLSSTNKSSPSSEVWKISTQTIFATSQISAMLASTNPPLPRSESSMSKYFLKYFHADLYEPKFQDLLIFGCVYSLLDYLSFPFWFSEKIFQSSPCKSNLEM